MQFVPITPWIPYLSAIAGVGAALTGLVFVAVSINLNHILKQYWLTDRAAESLLQLLGVVIVATVALIPRQSPEIFGLEMVSVGALFWLVQLRFQFRYMRGRSGHPIRWIFARVLQSVAAYVPLLIGAALLRRGNVDGLYWLPVGLLFSILAGVANAWVLLVEILR